MHIASVMDGLNATGLPGAPAPGLAAVCLPQRSRSINVFDPFAPLGSDSDTDNILDNAMWDSDVSDEPVDLEYIENLRAMRLKRSRAAYPYEGDLMQRINNHHEDESNN